MHEKLIDCQFRIVKFMPSGRFIGIAWNYDAPCMLATRDFPCYTETRKELGAMADKAGARLKWFDGEYIRNAGDDAIFPMTTEQSRHATCKEIGHNHL